MAAHETHANEPASAITKSKTSFSAALWFTILLIGLFIAALNFINVMGSGEHEKEIPAAREATSNETLKGETGTGRPKEEGTIHLAAPAASDSVHHEAAH